MPETNQSNPFADSNEGQMLLEKCKICGKTPSEIMNLPESEDTFLTYAISKKYTREEG